MKKKAFIMPIILIIFSIVVMISFSMYMRYLSIYNICNSKENELILKCEKISFDEIFKTAKMRHFINKNLDIKRNFKKEYLFKDIINEVIDPSILGINIQKYNNYKICLNVRQTSNNNFFNDKDAVFSGKLFNHEIFIIVKNEQNKSLFEYKFIDKSNIINYIIDLTLFNFIKTKKYPTFYEKFNLDVLKNKDLYKRIFTKENGEIFDEEVRIFNINKKIYYINNNEYNYILEKYIQKKMNEKNNELIKNSVSNLVDLDNFFRKNNLKKCFKKEFIENYLINKSKILYKDHKRNIVNFTYNNKIYFDLDKEIDIYTNININDNLTKIYIAKERPIIKGIVVNNSDKKLDFLVKGILFSKTSSENYKFTPEIIDIVTKIIKISEDYYVEKTDFNNEF